MFKLNNKYIKIKKINMFKCNKSIFKLNDKKI